MPNTLTHLNLSGNNLKEDVTVSYFQTNVFFCNTLVDACSDVFYIFVFQNLCNFLAQPNVISHLDISKTDCSLETVIFSAYFRVIIHECKFMRSFSQIFGALLRGCATNLVHLNVSHNVFNTKKIKELPPSFKQFFTSSIGLKSVNMSYCKLPLDALK